MNFSEICHLQNNINIDISGQDWTAKGLKWYRYIYTEATEAVDSLPYKHWKAQVTDYENLKTEFVDILHFVLSWTIEEYGSVEAAIEELERLPIKKIKLSNDESIILMLESLIKKSLDQDFHGVLDIFFSLIHSLKTTSIEEISRLYIGKHCLNSFRLNHGYKEGTYNKIWGGKEDNYHMHRLLDSGIDNCHELYAEFKKIYNNLQR